jgi:small subunit ribosomal protein S2
MAQYIFGARSGVHIIDLEQTQKKLEEAMDFVKGVVARGGQVLFVGTKRQAKTLVREAAVSCGMPFVTERWLGGTLTNFVQIKKSIKRLKTLKEQMEKGELRKYTKKEQLLLAREIEEMEEKLGGIADMEKLPEAMFVVDVRHEKTAVEEARETGTKIVALCDSNVNPDVVQYVIPANDDAVKGIALMVKMIAEAVQEGKAEALKAAPPVVKKA